MKKKHTLTLILLLATLTLAAQSNYSTCYTNNMSKGNTAFNQGKYSEARTYFANAKQCAGGNPSAAQQKINACDAKIKAQREAAEAKRRAEAEAAEAKRKAEEEERKRAACNTPVKDYDGNVYHTVRIGKQCWMKENLRTTHYADGGSISLGNIKNYSYTKAYRYYPNDMSANVSSYGYLYNWPAVMHGEEGSNNNPSGVQGICPTGWHVPSKAEFTQLILFVKSQPQFSCGGNIDNIAKSLASVEGWSTSYYSVDAYDYVSNNCECSSGNNPNANNATGFSAMPAGWYYYSDYSDDFNMSSFGTDAYFWTSSSAGRTRAYDCSLHSVCELAWENYYRTMNLNSSPDNADAFSVRCVRDE